MSSSVKLPRWMAAVSVGAAVIATTSTVQAEDIKLRIASGHAAATPYVAVLTQYFVPEVTKRVKERTKHTLEFIEGYGGAMVKVSDTLEAVQACKPACNFDPCSGVIGVEI